MQEADLVAKMLRAVLQSHKFGVPFSRLQGEYKSLTGDWIPFEQLGYTTLEGYLKNIPGVVRIEIGRNGEVTCHAVACEETASIAQLVARQRTAKRKIGRQVNCRMRLKQPAVFASVGKPKGTLRKPGFINPSEERWSSAGSLGWNKDSYAVVRPSMNYAPYPLPPPFPKDVIMPGQMNMMYRPEKKPTPPPPPPPRFQKEVQDNLPPSIPPRFQKEVQNNLPPPPPFQKEVQDNLPPPPPSRFQKEAQDNLPPPPPSRFQKEVQDNLSRNPSMDLNENVKDVRPVMHPIPACPSNANINEIQKRIKEILNRYSNGIWLSKIPHLYKEAYEEEFNTALLPQFENWPHVCVAEKMCSSGLRDILLYPATKTHNSIKGISSQEKKSESPLINKNAEIQAAAPHGDLKQKIAAILLKYSSGLWANALPKVYEDTFKAPFPQDVLNNLDLLSDVCTVDYISGSLKKAILYAKSKEHTDENLNVTEKIPMREDLKKLPEHPSTMVMAQQQQPTRVMWESKQPPAKVMQESQQQKQSPAKVMQESQQQQQKQPPARVIQESQQQQRQTPAKVMQESQQQQPKQPPARVIQESQQQQQHPPARVIQESQQQQRQTPAKVMQESQQQPLARVIQQSQQQQKQPPARVMQESQQQQPPARVIQESQQQQKQPPARVMQESQQQQQPPAKVIQESQQQQKQPPARVIQEFQQPQKQPPARIIQESQEEDCENMSVPPLIIPAESSPSVLVVELNSINEVVVRYVGKDYSAAQELMEDEMKDFYGQNPTILRIQSPKVGQLVAVPAEEDAWLRAQIISTEGLRIKVCYVDYGFSEIIEINKVYKLAKRFYSLPCQASKCKLAGLETFCDDCVLLETVESLTCGKIFAVEILDKSDIPLVVLYDTSGEDDININAACLKALRDKSLELRLQVDALYTNVKVTNVCSDGTLYCQVPSRGLTKLSEVLQKLENYFHHKQVTDYSVTLPYCGMICLFNCKGKWARVEITGVHSSRALDVQFMDTGTVASVKVTELKKIPPVFLREIIAIAPQATKCCLADLPLQIGMWTADAVLWLRDTVLNCPDCSIKVVKLDESNKIAHIYLFTPKSFPDPDRSINKQITNADLWKHQKDVFLSASPSGIPHGKGETNSSSLGNKTGLIGSPSHSLTPNDAGASSTMPLPLPLAKPGEQMDVFVSLACHPGYFVLQPWQEIHNLEVLIEEMLLYYSAADGNEVSVEKNKLYAAKVEKKWYRVLIKGMLANGLVSVYELDYGKHELVNIQNVQPLLDIFRKLPFQAIIAQLAGVESHQWSEEASIVFRNHVEKKPLVAQVQAVHEGTNSWDRKVEAYLVDTSLPDTDLWVHDIMNQYLVEISKAN